jgi:hypothetical protein
VVKAVEAMANKAKKRNLSDSGFRESEIPFQVMKTFFAVERIIVVQSLRGEF